MGTFGVVAVASSFPLLQEAHWLDLVRGTEIVGIFPTRNDAVDAGYDKLGLTPFVVKRIGPRRRIVFVPRIVER